jgi:hypothetical protein
LSDWTLRRLGWSVNVCSLVLLVAALILLFVDRATDLPNNVGAWTAADVLDVIVSLGVPILGIVVVNRQPRNAVGWLFTIAGIAVGIATFGQAYALHALIAAPGTVPGGQLLAWVSNTLWPIPICCLTLLFLLFPTGRLVSRRWRIVVGLTIAILLLLTIAASVLATASWSDPFAGFNIETGSIGAAARVAILISAFALPVAMLLSVVSIVQRFRGSSGDERLQLKWFVSTAAVTAIAFSVAFFIDAPLASVASSLALLGLWTAIGIAMVKHNLYEIDVILNKAIAYGLLAAVITAIYVVVVAIVGAIIGLTEGLSIVATAVVVVAFQPIRRRAQHFANRLVYGERATPYEVLSRFSASVGETYSGEDIQVRMVRLLTEGKGAVSADVWLANGDEMHPIATWPTKETAASVRVVDGKMPANEDATAVVPVKHRGELLGMLTVTKPPNVGWDRERTRSTQRRPTKLSHRSRKH